MSSIKYLSLYVLYASTIIGVGQLINSIVPGSYMDELVHIPQAQAYCRGDWFYWDPRLTTPPGLYLLSTLPTFLPLPSSLKLNLCSISSLRFLNTLFLLLLPLLYSALLPILNHPIHRKSTIGKSTPSKLLQLEILKDEERLEAGIIAIWPVLLFFGWIYYTDVGSTVLVLISLLASRKRFWFLSGLTGAASLFFRQTNIIWLAFIATTSIISELQSISDLYDPPLITARLIDIPQSIYSLISQSLLNLLSILPILFSYLPVFVAFGYFIHWNGGIVLGDKSNHIPTIHIPQIYYFLAFSMIFLAPMILNIRSLKRSLKGLFGSFSRIVVSSIVLGIICYTIKEFTMVHPFLLSDNRHYSFYIYRRIINLFPLNRYLLSLPYLIFGRLIYDRLAQSKTLTLLPTLIYLLCLFATLIPSPLIEPRYFIIPFILLRLHLPSSPASSPTSSSTTGGRAGGGGSKENNLLEVILKPKWLELIWFLIINVGTIGLFLYRPFKWDSESVEEQMLMRFMW